MVENQVVGDQAKMTGVVMRLVDKWLNVSGLREILGANGTEDYKDVTEYQVVSDQREEIRSGYALGMTRKDGLGMAGRSPRDQRPPGIRGPPGSEAPRETLQDIHALLADFFKFVFHADDKLLDAGVVGFGAGGVDLAAHFLDDEAQLFAGIGL